MSKLYFQENGKVISTLCEELTEYRRARSLLELPATRRPARLYVLARAYPGCQAPLLISVNGAQLTPIPPEQPFYRWYEVTVPAELIRAGENRIELWNDSPVMNSWSLGLEDGRRDPRSSVSSDGGLTWRSEAMGYLNVCRGEYLVRVRLEEGQDPLPAPLTWEDPRQPRLARLRALLPPLALQAGRPTLERARTLASWISSAWEYRHTGGAAQYTPWDPETILDWGRQKRGHDGRLPVVMCVHYGVTMVSACQAAGIYARPAVFTGEINGFTGHFATEVWAPEYQKWVYVDANLDAVLFKDGEPLSVAEIQELAPNLEPCVRWGPGNAFQRQNPVILSWIDEVFLPGRWVALRSVWQRADFLSCPQFSPPMHGATAYSETDLVWEAKHLPHGLGMFPKFADPSYFEAPPSRQMAENEP